jgi:hypothetical protein
MSHFKLSTLKPLSGFRISSFVLRISAAGVALLLCIEPIMAAEVRLRSAAVCSGSIARVADVAEVSGPDHRVADALAEIPLCPAPAAGQSRVLSQEDIRQLLALSGVERKTATVTGSESVTISRDGSPRTSPTTKQPLVAGGIRQAVFEVESAPTVKPRTVQPAAFQRPDSDEMKPIKEAPLVEKGARLTVHASAAGVRITAAGKAIDSGSIGESIGVELIDTKQKVVGRIVAPQTVEIKAETSSLK